MLTDTPTLGALLRNYRAKREWTLKEMSAHSGIPVSTLSKIEHDRLTLTYDKLQLLSQRLGLRLSELFAEDTDDAVPAVTARRSLGTTDSGIRVETPNYGYRYLCTELRKKRMIPVVTTIRATTAEQFGALVHHAGEEFIFVLTGRVVVVTDFYDAVTLGEGESIYLDSSMGHAYLVADGCTEATVLGVMSSADEELMQALLAIHQGQNGSTPARRGRSKG